MKKSSFLVAGKHAVTEALKNPKRKEEGDAGEPSTLKRINISELVHITWVGSPLCTL